MKILFVQSDSEQEGFHMTLCTLVLILYYHMDSRKRFWSVLYLALSKQPTANCFWWHTSAYNSKLELLLGCASRLLSLSHKSIDCFLNTCNQSFQKRKLFSHANSLNLLEEKNHTLIFWSLTVLAMKTWVYNRY